MLRSNANRRNYTELHRREFLKLCSAGIFGIFLKPTLRFLQDAPEQLGRVTLPKIPVHEFPSNRSKEIGFLFQDEVMRIAGITINNEIAEQNKTWYQIPESGFVQSANIQPVAMRLNPIILAVPSTGALAEVTVPYIDSYRGAGDHYAKAFRLYYETTHWVTNAVQDNTEKVWYRMVDDRWLFSYYAPAECLRFFKPGELSPISPQTPPEAKKIEIRVDKQQLIAYEWDMPVFMALVATGRILTNGRSTTPIGNHKIYYKRANRHMLSGTPENYDYDLPGVPWVSYFTRHGIAIHGTYWHNNFGKAVSHGCVNLPPKAAMWIYRWSNPIVPQNVKEKIEDNGTKIEIKNTAKT